MADNPIIKTFLIESADLLRDMEAALLALEKEPQNPQMIGNLFASVHTLKGAAGIVGVDFIQRFTHDLENMLDRIRENTLALTGEISSFLFEVYDHIVHLRASLEADGEPDENLIAEGKELTKIINQHLEEPTPEAGALEEPESGNDRWHISLRFGPDVLQNGMDPASIINYMGKVGKVNGLVTLTNRIPILDKISPENCYLSFDINYTGADNRDEIEEIFEFFEDDCEIHIIPMEDAPAAISELIDVLPEENSLLESNFSQIGSLTTEGFEENIQTEIPDKNDEDTSTELGDITNNDAEVEKAESSEELEDEKENAGEKPKKVLPTMSGPESQTIRVDISKLDLLINQVGELVIANSHIRQQAMDSENQELLKTATDITRLVEEIRDSTMQVRMIQIGSSLARFHRVVRDINHNLNKKIQLVIVGGDTELDKTVIEKLSDPIMHIIRNSADHGIEMPEDRVAAGKPEQGTIQIRAYNETGVIVIKISDDGRGISTDKVYQKAVSRGIVAENQQMSDHEIMKLIFEPGFSTVSNVTNISGRGVGMDVVNRNVNALRGTVDIDSIVGQGTEVTLRLPLSLAIIDGFLVKISGRFFVIQMEIIMECFVLNKKEREELREREYFKRREEIIPHLRLRDIFNIPGEPESEHMVVIQSGDRKVGLMVDELRGNIQAVIKSLGRVYQNITGVSGATILGDGSVALIIDAQSIIGKIENSLYDVEAGMEA